jgi:hypothetical protein
MFGLDPTTHITSLVDKAKKVFGVNVPNMMPIGLVMNWHRERFIMFP